MAVGLQTDILQQHRDKNCALRANRNGVEAGVARPLLIRHMQRSRPSDPSALGRR